MPDAEQRAWCRLLAPTKPGQLAVICDLLRHSWEDHMTGDDRLICLMQKWRLERELGVKVARAQRRRRYQGSNPEPVVPAVTIQ